MQLKTKTACQDVTLIIGEPVNLDSNYGVQRQKWCTDDVENLISNPYLVHFSITLGFHLSSDFILLQLKMYLFLIN